jgi:hypothetical protein
MHYVCRLVCYIAPSLNLQPVADPEQNPGGAELYDRLDLRLRPLSSVQRLLPKFQ